VGVKERNILVGVEGEAPPPRERERDEEVSEIGGGEGGAHMGIPLSSLWDIIIPRPPARMNARQGLRYTSCSVLSLMSAAPPSRPLKPYTQQCFASATMVEVGSTM
jgi:hypothetical protein